MQYISILFTLKRFVALVTVVLLLSCIGSCSTIEDAIDRLQGREGVDTFKNYKE